MQHCTIADMQDAKDVVPYDNFGTCWQRKGNITKKIIVEVQYETI